MTESGGGAESLSSCTRLGCTLWHASRLARRDANVRSPCERRPAAFVRLRHDSPFNSPSRKLERRGIMHCWTLPSRGRQTTKACKTDLQSPVGPLAEAVSLSHLVLQFSPISVSLQQHLMHIIGLGARLMPLDAPQEKHAMIFLPVTPQRSVNSPPPPHTRFFPGQPIATLPASPNEGCRATRPLISMQADAW